MLNFQTFLASALTAVVALITVSTDTKKIENRAAETEEKQRRFEVNRKIREEEEYRKKEHDKKSEHREAEYRNKIEKFMTEKDKLIAEKDKALEEKDKYFEEYRKMREEKEELNRKLYEEHQLFEKILRKMQSMAMMQLIQNSGDESMKKLCLEFTKI
ncbi:unnamed protein product, partial [Oikopleura dioica]